MEIEQLIKHPEKMNRETLYDLRSLIALYPYYQTARILLLQNLYILHDASFDEELRRSALYITDRRVIFNMVEAAHYQLRTKSTTNNDAKNNISAKNKEDRTTSLIDSFLDQIPKEAKDDKKTEKRKPTPADAAVDYVAYLLEAEEFVDVGRGHLAGGDGPDGGGGAGHTITAGEDLLIAHGGVVAGVDGAALLVDRPRGARGGDGDEDGKGEEDRGSFHARDSAGRPPRGGAPFLQSRASEGARCRSRGAAGVARQAATSAATRRARACASAR